MRVLVAYETTEGQTEKIANRAVTKIGELGHDAEIFDCANLLTGINIASFDAILVASPVHQRSHDRQVTEFVMAHREKLEKWPSAFISVSLSAAFDSGIAEAQEYIDTFVQVTGWQPEHFHLAAGALRYTEYDFFKEQIIRHIVMAGRDISDRSEANQDFELTDWLALDDFVAAFIESADTAVREVRESSKPAA